MTRRFDLSIERCIAAPPATVWRVMTDRIAEWWCPVPWTTTIAELDWRPGGAFHLVMRGPSGEADCQGEESAGGILLDYVHGERFVFTDAFSAGWVPQKPFMIGTFSIEPDDEGTRYRASAGHWTEQAMQQHLELGFEQGWGTVADQLAALAESQ